MSRPLYRDSAPYYDLIYGPLVDYERECDLLESIFRREARRKVHRVLDLGSGTGGHALVLAERGYEVVGIELQPAFVARAREKARSLATPPTFQEGDMRRLEGEGPFDALVSMFGAFGHVPRRDAPGTLRGFRDCLVPAGVLAFEFWNPGGARDGYRGWDERGADDLLLIRLGKSRVREGGKALEIRFKHYLIRANWVEDAFEETVTLALYQPAEMEALLCEARMTPVAMLEWDAKSLEPAPGDAFRILAVARREG